MASPQLSMVTLEKPTESDAEVYSLVERREALLSDIKRLLAARIRVGQRLARAELRFHQLAAHGDRLIAAAEAEAGMIVAAARQAAQTDLVDREWQDKGDFVAVGE